MKKNAILMIDFAIEAERQEGKEPEEAIFQACLLRFRPITMTTMAALLGGLPLAIGGGTGSELRRPLGIAIVGGLIFSQMLTLYTTPVVYLYLDRFRLRWEKVRAGSSESRARSGESVMVRRVLVASVALLSGACAVGPDYQKPPVRCRRPTRSSRRRTRPTPAPGSRRSRETARPAEGGGRSSGTRS